MSSSFCTETKIQLQTKEKLKYFFKHSNIVDMLQKMFLSKHGSVIII